MTCTRTCTGTDMCIFVYMCMYIFLKTDNMTTLTLRPVMTVSQKKRSVLYMQAPCTPGTCIFFLYYLQCWSNPRRRWRRLSWLWDLWNNVHCPLTYFVHWKNFHRRSSRRDLAAALARHPSVYAPVHARAL